MMNKDDIPNIIEEKLIKTIKDYARVRYEAGENAGFIRAVEAINNSFDKIIDEACTDDSGSMRNFVEQIRTAVMSNVLIDEMKKCDEKLKEMAELKSAES